MQTTARRRSTKIWYGGTYLSSFWWTQRRREYMERAEWRCERCRVQWARVVHHLDYSNLYCEADEDLMALCHDCHNHMHQPFQAANDNRQMELPFEQSG